MPPCHFGLFSKSLMYANTTSGGQSMSAEISTGFIALLLLVRLLVIRRRAANQDAPEPAAQGRLACSILFAGALILTAIAVKPLVAPRLGDLLAGLLLPLGLTTSQTFRSIS